MQYLHDRFRGGVCRVVGDEEWEGIDGADDPYAADYGAANEARAAEAAAEHRVTNSDVALEGDDGEDDDGTAVGQTLDEVEELTHDLR